MARTDIDSDLVRKLAALLEETGLSEIEYGTGTWRIRVAKHANRIVASASTAPACPDSWRTSVPASTTCRTRSSATS